MKYFLIRLTHFSLIGFIPIIILLFLYLYFDPFMVIGSKTKVQECPNRDYVSTTIFDCNYQKEQYNSFIFGNSRSILYQVSDWKKHLDSKSNCYHFDASGESLYALTKKVKYIDSKNVKIKNTLLILDFETLNLSKPKTGHLFVISPQLENNRNLFLFHFEFFKAFLSPKYLFAFFNSKLSSKEKTLMKTNSLINNIPMNYDIFTNEIRFDSIEKQISEGKYYTEERKKSFFERSKILKFSPASIAKNQKIMLQEIFDIFKRHNTKYRIIINPLYDQIKLNNKDLNFLIQLFGKESVFDYSGINKFTNDYNNYYEAKHYRPHVAREIMTLIYQNEKSSDFN